MKQEGEGWGGGREGILTRKRHDNFHLLLLILAAQERDLACIVAPFGRRPQSARGYLWSQLHFAC